MAGFLIQQVGATRQRRGTAEKREIVERTMQPGASVTRVAQQHGLKANQVFYWRNLYRQGRLGEESRSSADGGGSSKSRLHFAQFGTACHESMCEMKGLDGSNPALSATQS